MKRLAILGAIILLSSCAQVPKEEAYYPLSYQKKLQASEHWNLLAKNVSLAVGFAIGSQPVYISDFDRSPFGNAMRTLLTTELVNRGLNVTADENCPYKLNWDVQPVVHQAARRNNGGLVPFFLVVGEFIVGEPDLSLSKPHSEVIVTFKVMKNNVNLVRDTQIFYINDADRNHYWQISQQDSPKSRLTPVTYSVTKD